MGALGARWPFRAPYVGPWRAGQYSAIWGRVGALAIYWRHIPVPEAWARLLHTAAAMARFWRAPLHPKYPPFAERANRVPRLAIAVSAKPRPLPRALGYTRQYMAFSYIARPSCPQMAEYWPLVTGRAMARTSGAQNGL